jgi:heptosyltransferase II
MKANSHHDSSKIPSPDQPILIIPYMWIGDFVRCHSVVKLLKQQSPARPVDLLTTTLCAPLVDYMPGVRKGITWDLPRSRLALRQQSALGRRLRAEAYGQVLVMPRTWKSAIAPFLAGIPDRTGFAGELRLGLLNDIRWGERKLPRMVDRCAALALPRGATPPTEWPLPELVVSPSEISTWRNKMGLTSHLPVVALAPGAVGPSKRWTVAGYTEVAKHLGQQGMSVWVLGGPNEKPIATAIAAAGNHVSDLTGHDLRNAILALATADAAVSNDSGLLHVAAALGTPVIGVFGPTSPWHWAPLNPMAAIIETDTELPCRPCHKPTCRLEHHRCMRDIPAARVADALGRALAIARTKANAH